MQKEICGTLFLILKYVSSLINDFVYKMNWREDFPGIVPTAEEWNASAEIRVPPYMFS